MSNEWWVSSGGLAPEQYNSEETSQRWRAVGNLLQRDTRKLIVFRIRFQLLLINTYDFFLIEEVVVKVVQKSESKHIIGSFSFHKISRRVVNKRNYLNVFAEAG